MDRWDIQITDQDGETSVYQMTQAPVLMALNMMRVPHKVIGAHLGMTHPNFSRSMNGRRPLNLERQDKACEMADYVLGVWEAALNGENPADSERLRGLIEDQGDVKKHLDNLRIVCRTIRQMIDVQRQMIEDKRKAKGGDDGSTKRKP